MEGNRVRELPSPPTNPSSAIQRVPMSRKGLGTRGQKIQLLTNHFKVSIAKTEGHFYHYSIAFSYRDGHPVDEKGIGWKIIDKVQATYAADLAGKTFAYDGEKSLFTLGSLPEKTLNFTIVLDDLAPLRVADNGISPRYGKRLKRLYGSKTIDVEISFAAMVPLQSIAAALRGQETDCFQDAMRILDVILRQNAARRGCLLVRQSFFQNNPKNFTEVGGGVLGCRGFNSSFQATQGGLSLNMDVSTTIIVKPGPVINFLLMNQNVKDLHEIDWRKARKALKSLRIIVETTKQEYKITGLSDYPCKDQLFSMKQKSGNGRNGEAATLEITVYEYFVNCRGIPLHNSADFPCINVGKPKRPIYFPIELCSLISLQRYTRALSSQQRASLVEKSRQKPEERMRVLKEGLIASNYNGDPILCMAGISISSQFTQVEGRILPPPKLKVGNGVHFLPRNGRWNFNNKTLVNAAKINRWSVVNFSARCDICYIINNLMKCAEMKGIAIEPPGAVVEEEPSYRRAPPQVRVQKMLERLKANYGDMAPNFLLCILPERKNSEIYGPWKLKVLAQCGIVTQCIAPTKVNDQYLTNILLKINAKLGGLNSMLAIEDSPSMSVVSRQPTMILGMDVNHGSVGRDVPSIAAVVGSRQWPLISRYRASVRTQSPKVEMIASLFKPYRESTDGKIKDGGIMRELLLEFYTSSSQRKPEQIIIFRDGVSESQFNQVLNVELDQIIQACKFLDENWKPKFVVIIAQKRHHTKFFQANSPDNVPPGTVIDNHVGHPRRNDFYMVAHAGMMGTTRPTHYHVLYDEVGFTTDEVQGLVHSLSYVYQRSTSAISLVAPVQYAHLAAAQMSQFVNFDEMSDTSSSGVTSASTAKVPELPRLHVDVRNSMFFC